MGEDSKIEWCDHTFNAWIGCTNVSPACDNCYAETYDRRFGLEWGNAPRRRTSQANWRQPLKWNRRAKRDGVRLKVFCCSLADVFDNQVPGEWRTDLWDLIRKTEHLDWLLLTKRPQNIAKMLPPAGMPPWPWPHVWLGTTVENQAEADRRIPTLLGIPAARRFLSCEPLLGRVDLRRVAAPKIAPDDNSNGWKFHCLETGDCYTFWDDNPLNPDERCTDSGDGPYRETKIDWVIAGGESGTNARPAHPDWFRSLRDQCTVKGVPFFFKQWGEWAPVPDGAEMTYEAHRARGARDYLVFRDAGQTEMERVGKKRSGALLDGREWREMPDG